MIVCPICKEEIDDDSHYCDQCGQALFFCQQCGRVGVGRRCTYCGGLMVSPDGNKHAGVPTGSITGYVSSGSIDNAISQPGTMGYLPARYDGLSTSSDTFQRQPEYTYRGYEWCDYRPPSRTLYSVLCESGLCVRCARTVEILAQSRLVCRRQALV